MSLRYIGGAEVQFHSFLTSSLDRCEWLTPALAALPLAKNPGTRWIWNWLIPRIGLNVVKKRKTLTRTGIWTSDHPAYSTFAIPPVLVRLCHSLYYSLNIIWAIMEDNIDGLCGTQRGKEKYTGRELMGKPEGKRPLGIPRSRWKHSTHWTHTAVSNHPICLLRHFPNSYQHSLE